MTSRCCAIDDLTSPLKQRLASALEPAPMNELGQRGYRRLRPPTGQAGKVNAGLAFALAQARCAEVVLGSAAPSSASLKLRSLPIKSSGVRQPARVRTAERWRDQAQGASAGRRDSQCERGAEGLTVDADDMVTSSTSTSRFRSGELNRGKRSIVPDALERALRVWVWP
jgi:hypothetical protein